jgi:carbonic anhydrase
MSGADLFATFTLAQFPFHWGNTSSTGSEHTVDGKPVPLEIHFVHWNADKYSSYTEASNHSDGLAVLAVLVNVGNTGNSYLGQLTNYISNVTFFGNSTLVPSFPVSNLIPADRSYWRYSGSLTTPACYQSVTWTVLQQPIYITETQLSEFRKIHSKEGELLTYNYRPTQNLNGRIVYSSPSFVYTGEWNYEDDSKYGPSHWADFYPTCEGTDQSPIDFQLSTVRTSKALTDFTFTNYDKKPASFNMVNNGHSVQVNLPDNSITVSGAGFLATYTLAQFHFHWGPDNTVGSEHTVDGRAAPLEIHLVHWNSDIYHNFTEASAHMDGVAVLGIFVQNVSETDSRKNAELGGLTDSIDKVLHFKNQTSADPFAVQSLIPTNHTYYRYFGSLTTPGCSQVVTWTVFQNPIYITNSQMEKFREVHQEFNDTLLLERNYRPVQSLNKRVVYQSPAIISPTTSSAGHIWDLLRIPAAILLIISTRLLL